MRETVRIALSCVICALLLLAPAAAQENARTDFPSMDIADTKLAPFRIVDEGFTSLHFRRGRVALQFSLENISGRTLESADLVLFIYGTDGERRAVHGFSVPAALQPWQTRTFTRQVDFEIRSGDVLVLGSWDDYFTSLFAVAQDPQPETTECEDWCNGCAQTAVNLCGQGNIKSYSCTWGDNPDCSFECKTNAIENDPALGTRNR